VSLFRFLPKSTSPDSSGARQGFASGFLGRTMTSSSSNLHADTVVVLDFETTGLSPDCGDRAIEIGAVKIVDGKIVERFRSS